MRRASGIRLGCYKQLPDRRSYRSIGSEFNVTISPSDIAAGQTEPVNVTVSIELPPGDYAINLTIDAAISSSQFTPYDIEIPVLVTG